MKKTLFDSHESLRGLVAGHTRNWARNERDAKLFHIIWGWPLAELEPLLRKYRWSNDELERLEALHTAFKQGGRSGKRK